MFRLTWRLLLLLSLAASCAVAWAWTHSASRTESVFVRGWGRYLLAASLRGRVVVLRVNGDPAARPGQAWYGYTPMGAADNSGEQVQGGPAVFDLFPARGRSYGPVIVTSGIAQSTIPPPPGLAATTTDSPGADSQASPHRSTPGAARPAFTYDAVSMPHAVAIACLGMPLAFHFLILRRSWFRRDCPPCRSEPHRDPPRHCQVCGAKVE
jgi:hypothetical protein